jgi:hypothetical protein
MGFQRIGRSRLWLADHGWWLSVVEFQPSRWSKGSYLNVAAHWLWSDLGHLSFDFGGRRTEFEEYLSDERFELAVTRLAESAAEEAGRLIEIFPSINAVAATLVEQERSSPVRERGNWSAYHAGIAAGVVGDIDEAVEMFSTILDRAAALGSVLETSARQMNSLAGQTVAFRREVYALVAMQRRALKLPDLKTVPF